MWVHAWKGRVIKLHQLRKLWTKRSLHQVLCGSLMILWEVTKHHYNLIKCAHSSCYVRCRALLNSIVLEENQIFVANMLLDCDKGASEIVLHKKWQRRRSCQEASPHTLRCCTHRLTSQQLGCQSCSSSGEWISRDLMILWYTMNLSSQSQLTRTRTKNAFRCYRAAAIQMTKGADRMLLCPPRRHVALTNQQANKIA